MTMRALAALLALGSLAACTPNERPTAGPVARAASWQTVATDVDRRRLREWRAAFVNGLAQARASGNAPAIAREGALLQPDAAVGGAIANDDYRCRVIKLGARSPGLLPFVSYPAFNCRIAQSGRLQAFTKLSGSQRQVGYIFPHDQLRQVFLGTLVLGDEQRAITYGIDSDRDLAGFVERIGPRQFRLILPSPRYESLIDVVELVPSS
ncbi:DUF4893 domain-containing protein [Sphingomonas glaciei]|uniref:DUF4893 domain-containing protein n=1 Tax=Sphingomonas glaciei TaxID=2938948 RepID=A0ABY5MXF5_9SPHN|nr:DUF4893 domain-containing protein [Sphingomonas glaciei]UUR08164.1 DUF4893 domain-containing protein [Sphingomonas glaciei]